MKKINVVLILASVLFPLAVFVLVPKPYQPPPDVLVSSPAASEWKSLIYGPPSQREFEKMPDFTISGAGDTDYNGDYTLAGTNLGANYYELDPTHVLQWDGAQWYLANAVGNTTGEKYFSLDGDVSTVPLTGWTVNSGTMPAPTVAPYSPPSSGSAAMLAWAYKRRN